MRRLLALVLLLGTAACDGSPTRPSALSPSPADTGAAPVAGLMVASDDLGSRDAIVALSQVAVDATASIGSRLTFSIDFGDGTTTVDPGARHIYQAPGTFTITCVVRDAVGRTATTARPIVVKTLTGRWFHAAYVPRAREFELRSFTISTQEGLVVRGVYRVSHAPDRSFTGRLTSPRTMHIVVDDQTVQLEGVVPGSLNEESLLWTLLMRGDMVDGERLAFRPVLGEPSGPPPDAVLRIRFDSFGASQPIQGLSPIRFDGSTSRGDGLSYVIEFGDGEVSTEPTVIHRIDQRGQVSTRLTVFDRFARTDAEVATYYPFPVLDYCCSSQWYTNDGTTFRNLRFTTRQGLRLTGSFNTQGVVTSFVATLSGERDIRIVVDALGIELRGYIELGNPYYRMVLTQTGGPDHGRIWTFLFDDGPG